MRVLVTGREGQVARSLAEEAVARGIELVHLARPELDLFRPQEAGDALARAIDRERPDAVVSAAAYTAVDKAEDEPELAHAANAEAPGAMARAADAVGVPFIHVSTDYVFDGTLDRPYREDDPIAPPGVYGLTKEAGERAVRENAAKHVILRTAWVTSVFGSNFVRTMLRLAETRDRLGIVGDQLGCPTGAHDLARVILSMASHDKLRASAGTYHAAGAGETTWADLARHVFTVSQAHGGPSATVDTIRTEDYPTSAKRPANSRLDCTRLDEEFGVRLADWQKAQAEIVERLISEASQCEPEEARAL